MIKRAPSTDSTNKLATTHWVQETIRNVINRALNRWVAKKTMSIPFGKVDSTSASTVFTASVDGITELTDGVCVYLRNDVVTSASGWTLNINGLGAKPVYSSMADATRVTTTFNVNYTMMFIYNSSRVTGGCWDMFYGYDSNSNTIGYILRTNSMSLPVTDATYRYRIMFTSPDGEHLIPSNSSTSTNATALRTVNPRPINPFGRIVYYNYTSAVAVGNRPGASYLLDQTVCSLGYSFNRLGHALALTPWEPVYLVCTPQSDGSAIIDPDTPYVQTLPTSADGKIYIHLGVAYSATNIELTIGHPIYYYDNGIRHWMGNNLPYVTSADNGKTLTVVDGKWMAV